MNKLAAILVLGLAGIVVAQNVTLLSPADNATLDNGSVMFVFNATDDLDPVLDCTLLLDGAANASLSAQSGNETSLDVSGIAEGAHNWSVSCNDDQNSTGVSETRSFSVELPSIPEVSLISPEDNATLNDSSASFVFVAFEENESLDCTLLLDGAANASVAATSGENASVPVSGLAGGSHNWSVSCTDEENETGVSETRSFSVELAPADGDQDGVPDDSDMCPASAPDTMKLNPNQYGQLDLSTSAFELGAKKKGLVLQSLVYGMNATKGCTCAQIVEKLHLGKGLLKKGCSPGIMQRWTGLSFLSDLKAGTGAQSSASSAKGKGKAK